MTQGQIVALVWGPFAIALGTYAIIFRSEVSARARAQRARQGFKLSPRAQSPLVQLLGGAAMVVAGIAVAIGGLTGALR